jgi:outer membrane biosynthesis protein TonB
VPISYSRAQLEQIIKSGGSVIINGRHIDRLEDLPSESELAVGDRERAQAAIRANDDQIATLTRERQKLQAQLDAAPNQPPAPETPPQPARAGDKPVQPAPEAEAAPVPAEAPKPSEPPAAPQAEAPAPPRPGQPLFAPPPPRAPTPPDEGEGDDRGQRARGRRGA